MITKIRYRLCHNYSGTDALFVRAMKLGKTNATVIFLLDAYGNEGQIMFNGVLRNNTVVWKRTDNFGCNDLSSLASALGAVYGRGIVPADIDSISTSGIYHSLTLKPTNAPDEVSTYGILLCFTNTAFYLKTQIWFDILNGGIYTRTYHDTTWDPWKKHC